MLRHRRTGLKRRHGGDDRRAYQDCLEHRSSPPIRSVEIMSLRPIGSRPARNNARSGISNP
ncbi:conserved hypothetical protein [Afipia carboxidovorans OM5]|nr:conserved hypothetical protein [Afipia carboxidovorans OM5]